MKQSVMCERDGVCVCVSVWYSVSGCAGAAAVAVLKMQKHGPHTMSLSAYNYPSHRKTDTTSVASAAWEQPNEPRQVRTLIKYTARRVRPSRHHHH